jgi:hypothetical protein
MVISFADPDQGHHGGIYQAGNWYYLGKTIPRAEFRDATGRVWNYRTIEARRLRSPGRIDMSVFEKVRPSARHRYLMPLDKSMRRQVAKFAQPYPAPARPLVSA